ncbi:uncharacterized protein FTJAE_3590 [Fusarium tjaetaba]|uniref:Zn(2)-C6 fungal-type domain-containing protein n=1 Tax=Fusarium tjaetaba TaxID=1567544 RepID=A0A8H5RZ88_9HYPO|nr:uncharacterized protein FTJAE_3590 [Fusarium tjaetaba]KAF5642433.1 hypothetical protein FTJAE_3590 [Fusarium tjaetaba]
MISLLILGTTMLEQGTFDLPEGWWSDPVRFQLERRAIFSQTWICVSHRGRFRSPGDYVVYDVAGFRILMILGKDMVVRSFHNVCRHRAFPVARKQSGSATVLGCRYHGWSYNTEGKLTKAPYFDELPGFDRSLNSLFEIHTKQDDKCFLHVNVSRHEGVSATATPRGVESGRLGDVSPDAELLDSIEFSGKFNWKVVLNQPYAISPPAKSTFTAITSSTGELQFFPLTTVHLVPGQPFWYQLTYSPVTVDQTNLRCDIYTNSPKASFKFDGTTKCFLEKEIKQKLLAFENQYKQLITSAEEAIGNGYQAKIAAAVEMHRRQEALRGFEIKPAALKQQNGDDKLSKAERIEKETHALHKADVVTGPKSRYLIPFAGYRRSFRLASPFGPRPSVLINYADPLPLLDTDRQPPVQTCPKLENGIVRSSRLNALDLNATMPRRGGGRQTRLCGRRSRGGCSSCKQRHVKCDESRPTCTNCAKKGLLCDGYPQRTLRWSYKHEITANETSQQQNKSLEPLNDNPTIIAPNPPTTDDHTREEDGEARVVADDEMALWPQSEDIGLSDLLGFDSTNMFDHEFSGSLESIAIETPTFDFLTFDQVPDFCFDTSPQGHTWLDPGLSNRLQLSGIDADPATRLLKCWFDEICPAWSGFDSKSNMNRRMAEDLWQSSPPVFTALQSMSASFLSARLPQMRQSAMNLLKTATLSVQAEIQELNEKDVVDEIPIGILFALICLGTTICWLDTRRVGWPFLQEAKKLFRWTSQQQFAADADRIDFFNKSLVYWDMLISLIYDPEPGTDIHQVSELPSSFPRSHLLATYSQPSYETEPHPRTGVSLLSTTLFTRSIRLCRVYRRRTTERALDSPPTTPEIEQAKELEVELLQLQLSPRPSINNTDDPRTPATHLLHVAEAYQLASLLQIYIQFPALLKPPSQLNPRDFNEAEITMLWHKRIIPLTLRLIEVLEQIPSESRSCAIQPLLYMCAATGLRHTPACSPGTEPSSGSPAKPRPMESILDYLDLLKDPVEHSKEDIDPLSISQTTIDVSKGRTFILRRLSVFKECLHPGPIAVAEEFVKELWDAYDEAPRWSMDVCWISLMDKKDLRTLFG